MSRDSVPLREWINGAVDAIDIDTSNELLFTLGADPRTLALSSNDFLTPALRVARSLAREICQAEDIAARQENRDGWLQLPTPDTNWADRIFVHLSTSGDEILNDDKIGDLKTLPLSPDDATDEHEDAQDDLVKCMGKTLVERNESKGYGEKYFDDLNQLSLSPEDPTAQLEKLFEPLFDIDTQEEEQIKEKDIMRKFPYLSVDSAFFLPLPSSDVGRECDPEGDIYSLGLVLYELFSGGDKPLESMTQSRRDEETLSHQDNNLEPLSYHHQNCTIDLTSALKIRDATGDSDDLVGVADDRHGVNHNEEQSRKKKTLQCADNMRFTSIVPLKSKGLPCSLCNLIANMLDCAKGDMSGDDCYRHMSDVWKDLQLMLEKPDVYLHDLDLVKTSMAGLPKDTTYGRETEFSTLQKSYQRSISGENYECALIQGISGSGKSCLANRLGTFVTSTGAIFLSGKFDQMQQATPFSALASAFNQYCDMLLKEGEQAREKVAHELEEALGKEIHHLAKIIPHLVTILDEGRDGNDQDCADAQKRIEYMMCTFVEVISKDRAPIILFLDDLQWADASSISFIKQLLLVSNTNKKFYFVGCCREEGIDVGDPVSTLTNIRQLGVSVTTIKLACMDEERVNTMISIMLGLSPRLTRNLANTVHHKTKGLPLFLSQVMNSVRKHAMLWFSLSDRRWKWDIDRIRSIELPDNIAKYFASTIGKLPTEVQSALFLLSCFGACTQISWIKTLESKLSLQLIVPLEEVAVEEGLIDRIDESYRFCHDHVQTAVYSIIPPEERCLLHFKYGMALAAVSIDDENDDLLFISASQMNLGGPASIKDADEGVIVAQINLSAGKKAVEMCDFASAHRFFDNGISFLRKNHWHDHYNLSLELFEAASKSAFAIGDLECLQLLSQQIFTFAKTFEDTLSCTYITVGALAYTNKLTELIEKAISVLNKLGEALPESFTETETSTQIELTRAILNRYTDEQLLNYKTMEDPNKIMAMKFYSRLETATQNARPDLQPIITLKMVQLSFAYGWSPMTPLGITYFGMLLAKRLGKIREGYRLTNISGKLMERIGSKEVAGEVIFVATQLKCFCEPVQSANESHLEGYKASMIAGDMSNAMTNVMFYTIGTFGSGVKLQKVKENCANARRLMKQFNHKTWLIALAPLERSIMRMIGTEDATMPEENNLQETNAYPSMVTYLNNVYMYFMFRSYDQMKDNAEKYYACEKVKSWSLLYSHVAQELFGGLCSFWIYRVTGDRIWLERGKRSKSVMKGWADSSQWSFENRYLLLDAEEHFCHGDVESSQSSYDKAIFYARERRFVQDEALGSELAGYFFLEQGMKEASLNHFGQAHIKYIEWGALAKATVLFESIQQIFGPLVNASPPCLASSEPVTTSTGNVRKRSPSIS